MDTTNWCELCKHRQAKHEERMAGAVLTPAGFCSPSGDLNSLGVGDGCYLWPEKPLKWYRKMYGWRQGKREWLEDQEFVGIMVHAFVGPIEFPEISVRRGGITYGGF